MRPDMSDQLIHFTRGENYEDAFRNICRMVDECVITGGKEFWSGEHCVCFTEAPLNSLPGGFVNSKTFSRYSPFGIICDRDHMFDLGARPVIYGPSEEVSLFPEHVRWRYMKYNPNESPPYDFTWEREWRIRACELKISPDMAGVVVPGPEWADRLVEAYEEKQDWHVEKYALVLDSSIAYQYREAFKWQIYIMKIA